MMNRTKQESRTYNYVQNGKPAQMSVTYTLQFNGAGSLIKVINQEGFSIEKTSECMEYFQNKYKK